MGKEWHHSLQELRLWRRQDAHQDQCINERDMGAVGPGPMVFDRLLES